jgi:arsenate reductase
MYYVLPAIGDVLKAQSTGHRAQGFQPKMLIMKILILCTGNSCRSQMAQGFMQSFDDKITVKSAGTIPADAVNPTAVKVMAEAGIDISKNNPKSVDDFLKEEWDYVITVCDEANESCPFFTGKVKHRLHMGFTDPSKAIGSQDFIMNEFHSVRDQIKEAFYSFYKNNISKNV